MLEDFDHHELLDHRSEQAVGRKGGKVRFAQSVESRRQAGVDEVDLRSLLRRRRRVGRERGEEMDQVDGLMIVGHSYGELLGINIVAQLVLALV